MTLRVEGSGCLRIHHRPYALLMQQAVIVYDLGKAAMHHGDAVGEVLYDL